jgi:hydrogenase large subunit
MGTNVTPGSISKGNFGPIERALEGQTIKDIQNPIEVFRIIYSFAPCVNITLCLSSPDGTCIKKYDIEP